MRKTEETEAWERAMKAWDSAEHELDELLARIRNDPPEEQPDDARRRR